MGIVAVVKMDVEFEVGDMDIYLKKYGKTIIVDFSATYKLLKYRESTELRKIAKDITYKSIGGGHYMLYKYGAEYMYFTANEFNAFERCAYKFHYDYWDEPIDNLENRLKIQLFFLTHYGKAFKKLFVQETVALIPDGPYGRNVFFKAYSSIDHRNFYRKTCPLRFCDIREALRHEDYFFRLRDLAVTEIKSVVDAMYHVEELKFARFEKGVILTRGVKEEMVLPFDRIVKVVHCGMGEVELRDMKVVINAAGYSFQHEDVTFNITTEEWCRMITYASDMTPAAVEQEMCMQCDTYVAGDVHHGCPWNIGKLHIFGSTVSGKKIIEALITETMDNYTLELPSDGIVTVEMHRALGRVQRGALLREDLLFSDNDVLKYDEHFRNLKMCAQEWLVEKILYDSNKLMCPW